MRPPTGPSLRQTPSGPRLDAGIGHPRAPPWGSANRTLCAAAFIIQAYGSVLAPLPGGAAVQGNLSRTLSSVVGTACLRAEGGVGPQLTSHVFGLLKARSAEGQGVEDRWLSSDEGTEWVIRTVDAIVDALSPAPESGPQAKL